MILLLPNEIIYKIIEYLSYKDILIFQKTNKIIYYTSVKHIEKKIIDHMFEDGIDCKDLSCLNYINKRILVDILYFLKNFSKIYKFIKIDFMNTFMNKDYYKKSIDICNYNNKCCFLIYFNLQINEIEEILLRTTINNKKIFKKYDTINQNFQNNSVVNMNRIDYNTIYEHDEHNQYHRSNIYSMISLYFVF